MAPTQDTCQGKNYPYTLASILFRFILVLPIGSGETEAGRGIHKMYPSGRGLQHSFSMLTFGGPNSVLWN